MKISSFLDQERMSFIVDLSDIHDKEASIILDKFTVKGKKDIYNPDPITAECFVVKGGNVHLPLGRWREYYKEFPNKGRFDRTTYTFTKQLLTKETDPSGRKRDQDLVIKEAMEKLKRDHVVFISCFTGFGKSCCLSYITASLGLKTVIICHISEVNKQWKTKTYSTFTNAKVQLVKGKTLDPDADVYVMGIRKAANMNSSVFKNIGIVAIDEAHIATITAFTETLTKFTPKYLIGLSATPDRRDGLDKLIHLYFGQAKNYIIREEIKKFVVVKYTMKYIPIISYTYAPNGNLIPNWVEMANSIQYNRDYQKEVVGIARNHPQDVILILFNRKKPIYAVHEALENLGESVDYLADKKDKWNRHSRILVAGPKKVGVGFDWKHLTMIIIAYDTRDVRQIEGRARRLNCTIYDIVCNYSTFENHWDIHEKWYTKRGATIRYEGYTKPKPVRRLK